MNPSTILYMRPDWSLLEFFHGMPAALLQVGVLRDKPAATMSTFGGQHIHKTAF
jgi:hypothetical protein